jgi:SAM-dependent methyltransferase
VLVVNAPASLAQTPAQTPPAKEPYAPKVGQEGKDAVWVPTSDAMVERMLDHVRITPRDFIMDLGSGDGRMIIAAARRGTPGLGIEYNNDLVEFARRRAAEAGVADKAKFAQGDMYAADISKATVLALFLLPSNLEKLAPKFLDLPPGTRIVANSFWVPGWTPDDTITLESGCENWCTSQLMIIPAKVHGTWRVGDGTLLLNQRFQMVEGTYTPPNGTARTVKGRLKGNALTLSIADVEYEGKVNGNTFQVATKAAAKPSSLTATRSR